MTRVLNSTSYRSPSRDRVGEPNGVLDHEALPYLQGLNGQESFNIRVPL